MKCPSCKTNYNDPIEIETIKEFGWCLECEKELLVEVDDGEEEEDNY